MDRYLGAVVHALTSSRDENEIKLHLMDDSVGQYFGAQHWGIEFYDKQLNLTSIDVRGIKNVDNFVERYQQLERGDDPLLGYVLKYHAPTHEETILPLGRWKQSKIYQNFCAYYNHEHTAIAPIVYDGHLVAAIHLARTKDIPAFNSHDLASLSAVSLHCSAILTKLRIQKISIDSPIADCLTDRELQVAELVAQGLTNAEIGVRLWISVNTVKQTLKNIFRKLDVSARAQMVAKLKGVLNDIDEPK